MTGKAQAFEPASPKAPQNQFRVSANPQWQFEGAGAQSFGPKSDHRIDFRRPPGRDITRKQRHYS
jgi:hypothetical protein